MTEGQQNPADPECRFRGIALVLFLGAIVAVFQLALPLYAMQVFDRVLTSRSVETLLTLSILLVVTLSIVSVIDHARRRLFLRIGIGHVQGLLARLPARAMLAPGADVAGRAQRVAAGFGSAGPVAMLDLPWMALHLAALHLLDPAFFWLALCAGVILSSDAALSALSKRTPGLVTALPDAWTLGAPEATAAGLRAQLGQALARQARQTDRPAARRAAISTFRILVQSATLGLGAYLVLAGRVSPGMLIAASFLMSRALHPLDVLGGQAAALAAWWRDLRRLQGLAARDLADHSALSGPMRLRARAAEFADPRTGRRLLRGIDLDAKPGQVLAIAGRAGAGKSALVAGLCGGLALAGGQLVRSGAAGAPAVAPQYPQFGPVSLVAAIRAGRPDPDGTLTRDALDRAGLADVVAALPGGLGAEPAALSAGQRWQLGLARALFGRPACLILDDPFTALDGEGRAVLGALARQYRDTGGILILTARDPGSVAGADAVLYLDEGRQRFFGTAAQLVSLAPGARAGRSMDRVA